MTHTEQLEAASERKRRGKRQAAVISPATSPNDLPHTLTAKQVANWLQCSEKSVRRWFQDGRLRGNKTGAGNGRTGKQGGYIMVAREDLLAFVNG